MLGAQQQQQADALPGGASSSRSQSAAVRAQLAQLEPDEHDALRRYAHALANCERGRARGWTRQLWVVHLCLLGLAVAAALVCSVYLSFILVPLAVSYFLTFLLHPVTQLLTQRPLVCCGRPVCADLMRRNSLRANRDRLESTDVGSSGGARAAVKQCGLDLFLLGRLPHTAAALLTLALALGVVFGVAHLLVVDVMAAWSEAPQHYLPSASQGDQVGGGAARSPWEQDLHGAITMWHRGAVELVEAETGLRLTFGLGDLAEGVGYNRTQGWSLASVQQGASLLMAVMNYVFIVLLLATYLMVGVGATRAGAGGSMEHQAAHGRPARRQKEGGGVGPAPDVTGLVHGTLRDYVGRKTRCALLVGFGSWFVQQHICKVKLSVVWGFGVTMLAYVPFLGPTVSFLLPVPFIVLDRAMSAEMMWLAILWPPVLHVLINRWVEPMLHWLSDPTHERPFAGGGGPIVILTVVVIAVRLFGFVGGAVCPPLLMALCELLDRGQLPASDHPAARAVLSLLKKGELSATAPTGAALDTASAFSELDLGSHTESKPPTRERSM